MTLQKISQRVLVAVLSLLLCVTAFVPSALAQPLTQPLALGSCSLDGFLSMGVTTVQYLPEVSQIVVSGDIINSSAKTFPGVRVGYFLYDSESATTPSYVAFASDELYIDSNSPQPFSRTLDVSALPAGTYSLQVTASQGDFDNLLTSAMHTFANTPRVAVVKSGEAVDSNTVSISVNGETAAAEGFTFPIRTPLSVEVRTTNTGDVPLLDSSLEMVVTRGDIPAGTAVSAEKSDEIKLLPGSFAIDRMNDRITLGGEYTLFTALDTPDVFNELHTTSIQLGDEDVPVQPVYLLGAGVSRAGDTVNMTACLVQISDEAGYFLSESVALGVAGGEQVVFGQDTNSFTAEFTVPVAEASEGITLELRRAANVWLAMRGDDQIPEGENNELQFEVVDTVVVQYDCGEECPVAGETIMTTGEPQPSQRFSFYYYAGIVIAAALLGYIMIRRLHPEDGEVEEQPADVDADTNLQ